LAGLAVTIEDHPSQPLAAVTRQSVVIADDEQDAEKTAEKKQVYERILADRAKKVRFHALPSLPNGPLGNFLVPAELNKIMSNCPFHASKPLGPKEKAPVRAFLLSPELFPGCMVGGRQDFRLPPNLFRDMDVGPALMALWKWIVSARKPDDLIIVFDGRFRKLRTYFDTEINKLGENFTMEIWMIYQTPEESDFRYPTRKLAFSNSNRECILVYRPVSKKKTSSQPRSQYNACGEQSTFDLTYSGVQLRTLGELPKLTTEDKKKMMGSELDIPLSYNEEVDPAAEGVPFSWAETKPVAWWGSFFTDLGIDQIFDTCTGSTAAATGAFYANLQYDGVCCNPLHKTWCEQLMDKSMFAVMADGGGVAHKDPEFISKVLRFFGPAVDEGMRMLKAELKAGSAKAPGDDDDDGDESDGADSVNDDGFGH
jgi:hypothetical protein